MREERVWLGGRDGGPFVSCCVLCEFALLNSNSLSEGEPELLLSPPVKELELASALEGEEGSMKEERCEL